MQRFSPGAEISTSALVLSYCAVHIFCKSAYILGFRLYFHETPIFWDSAYIFMKRQYFGIRPIFSWDANILDIRQYFHEAPIFWISANNFIFRVFANVLGRCQYFLILLDFVAANICVYFQYLFLRFVCANIFGAIVLKLRFKIDVVVMIIWSIVIIINSVLTLQVSTASLPHDREPCEIKVVSNHTCSLHTCVCAGSPAYA